MDPDHDWSAVLAGHPIFSPAKAAGSSLERADASLELSSNTLPKFTQLDPEEDGPAPSGRRQVMVLKDADLIVAVGREIRMASLGDARLSRSTRQTYKTLHTPNIQFEIHQISLNPSGKLLAVAGAFQVAVIVLPRGGFTRLVPDKIDCKSVQVGQFYHASNAAAPIAKIEWHPWGEAGSTLMVMATDGRLREYDISVDTQEPQQVLSFMPEKRTNSFFATDSSEREVASFTFGKGRADWGPLTIYAVTKSGDVYSICPYMPQNASIPSSYVHSLECFIGAKQEFLAQEGTSVATKNLSTLYDYQRKYVTALVKQLPPGTVFPAASRSVLLHPPTTIRAPPTRQGPFLLQPSPRTLDGSEGGDATDISYLAFDTDDDEGEGDGGETEHLGVVMIAFQDGKVDVCFDVEKVEARWDSKTYNRDLPMLAVYETIDLGIISTLKDITLSKGEPSPLDLLQANHPVFQPDPIHTDAIYVYHAFGVHALNIAPVLQSLALALRTDDDSAETSLDTALQKSAGTSVQPILTTFSVERKCSTPVIAVTIPNDVYLTYSIFILTSAMLVTSFPLNLRSDSPHSPPRVPPAPDKNSEQFSQKSYWLTPPDGPSAYVSLLQKSPYTPPAALTRASGLPNNPKLSLPQSTKNAEFMLTPDTLRYLGTTGRDFASQSIDIKLAVKATDERMMLQQEEISRMAKKCRDMQDLIEQLKGPRREASEARFKKIQAEQKTLLERLDRMLQSLMERASPEISEHETKWFEELKRMKGEIVGIGKYDEGSLAARTRLLEREYARLTPALKELSEKEKRRKEKLTESTQGLGFSQAFEFGERSNLERLRISGVERQILDLAAKVDVTLGRPPSAQ